VSGHLTLSEALKSNRLGEFIAQAEAAGIGPISAVEFDTVLGGVLTAPQPEDQTSRSPGRGGSRGK
jgi:hypothetical protein